MKTSPLIRLVNIARATHTHTQVQIQQQNNNIDLLSNLNVDQFNPYHTLYFRPTASHKENDLLQDYLLQHRQYAYGTTLYLSASTVEGETKHQVSSGWH